MENHFELNNNLDLEDSFSESKETIEVTPTKHKKELLEGNISNSNIEIVGREYFNDSQENLSNNNHSEIIEESNPIDIYLKPYDMYMTNEPPNVEDYLEVYQQLNPGSSKIEISEKKDENTIVFTFEEELPDGYENKQKDGELESQGVSFENDEQIEGTSENDVVSEDELQCTSSDLIDSKLVENLSEVRIVPLEHISSQCNSMFVSKECEHPTMINNRVESFYESEDTYNTEEIEMEMIDCDPVIVNSLYPDINIEQSDCSEKEMSKSDQIKIELDKLEIVNIQSFLKQSNVQSRTSKIVFKIWRRYNTENIRQTQIKIRNKGKSLQEIEEFGRNTDKPRTKINIQIPEKEIYNFIKLNNDWNEHTSLTKGNISINTEHLLKVSESLIKNGLMVSRINNEDHSELLKDEVSD